MNCFRGKVFSFWGLFLFSVSLFVSIGQAKSKVPSWVTEAAKGADSYERLDDDANAMVLLDAMHLAYEGKSEIKRSVRHAVHIRTRDERARAGAVIPISNPSQKIVKFNAWMLYPSGRIESFKKGDLFQLASNLDALYSESKNYILDKTDSARENVVFAYEYEMTERNLFLQTMWPFQAGIPTLKSRLSVEVPNGWTSNGQIINDIGIEFSRSGNVATWEGRNMLGVKDEVSRPPATLLYAQVGVSVDPSERDKKSGRLKDFASWNDLARYGAQVQDEGLPPNNAIAEKAQELTASSSDTWSKLKAIGEYTQSVNYVMIDMDVNSGGGYTPHDAVDVFERHYGDCKDMTILTRSMLSSLGMNSFAVIASVGPEAYVHDEWPSPLQFNHCIVAIPVGDEVDKPAVVEHPKHGRLLIFDPTQKFTPVGDLPGSLQGTKILVASEQTEELIELPRNEAELNAVKREISVSLGADGALSGTIQETLTGSGADYIRMMYRNSSEEDYRKFLTTWLSRGTRDATISNVESVDLFDENSFKLTIDFSSPHYARRMGDSLLVFNPVFLSRHDWVPPIDEERTADYVFSSWLVDETTRFALPEGYELDAIAEPYENETSFVSYNLKSEMGDDEIVVTRRMVSHHEVIPASRYEVIVEHFEELTRSENRPVVLAKK